MFRPDVRRWCKMIYYLLSPPPPPPPPPRGCARDGKIFNSSQQSQCRVDSWSDDNIINSTPKKKQEVYRPGYRVSSVPGVVCGNVEKWPAGHSPIPDRWSAPEWLLLVQQLSVKKMCPSFQPTFQRAIIYNRKNVIISLLTTNYLFYTS